MKLGMQSQHKQQKKKVMPQDNKKVIPKKKPNTQSEVPPKENKKTKIKSDVSSKETKKAKPKLKSKKSAKEAKNRLSDVLDKRTVEMTPSGDAVSLQDTMSTQSLISLLLTVVLCITLSYLIVTYAADKLTMYWMGV